MTSQTAREAAQNLRNYQRQLDADGTFVGVSRQALDEVLDAFARIEAEALARGRLEGAKAREALLKAATDLRDDMIMRAEMNKHRNGGEVVVEAGNGVWFRFCAAIVKGLNDAD